VFVAVALQEHGNRLRGGRVLGASRVPASRSADAGKVFFFGSWASGLGLHGRAPRAGIN